MVYCAFSFQNVSKIMYAVFIYLFSKAHSSHTHPHVSVPYIFSYLTNDLMEKLSSPLNQVRPKGLKNNNNKNK